MSDILIYFDLYHILHRGTLKTNIWHYDVISSYLKNNATRYDATPFYARFFYTDARAFTITNR